MRRLRVDRIRLAWPLARRDLLARYRGSVAGLAWALMGPLAMVAIYAFVFQGVFKARWAGDAAGGGIGYAMRLFAGLIVFTSVAEAATRATRLIQDHANLVKRVVFPLEMLVVALVMQVGVHVLLQTVVLGAALLVTGQGPRASWLALPLALAWVLALQYVLVLALAALGAYVRDLQHLVPLLVSGLLFLSPVFYSSAAAPEALRWVLQWNPLTAPIELSRAAWFGDAVDVAAIWPQALALPVLGAAGAWLFTRLRPGFADLV
ncbi:MAG: ABC transporter permease [Burkholderiales bacterium]|nr:ABC transporter permease [Burkholderiales bacterium]